VNEKDRAVLLQQLRTPQRHEHCMHPFEGALHMVLQPGHVLLKCCECDHAETKHKDHWKKPI